MLDNLPNSVKSPGHLVVPAGLLFGLFAIAFSPLFSNDIARVLFSPDKFI